MAEFELAEFLPWDSQFFGVRIGRATGRRIDEAELAVLLEWCRAERIECLYFLADPACKETVPLLEENGFRNVDTRVTLACRAPFAAAPFGGAEVPMVREWQESDLDALGKIARKSHTDSRFFYDEHFPRSLCERLYQIWIERSCRGWAEAVLAAGPDGDPIGYVTCHLSDGSSGHIGLIALRGDQQGRGLGRDLLAASVCWFRDHGATEIGVVTQGRNIAAQRLYQGFGFRTVLLEQWFHRWFL